MELYEIVEEYVTIHPVQEYFAIECIKDSWKPWMVKPESFLVPCE